MDRKRLLRLLGALTMALMIVLTGCGGGSGTAQEGSSEETKDPGIADGTYVATFTTDSGMFHVSEANNDKGLLTVKDGEMSIHISLQSKRIINLFPGTAEDAQKDGAKILEPTTDEVTYEDGITEEVYGFDVPVPAIDEEFDLALLGTKGKWYDHKVKVSNPVEGDDLHAEASMDLEDGEYDVEASLEGGTGRATIESPTKLTVKDGKATMLVTWSSENYDYMLVDGEKYLPVNEEGNSQFEIPVPALNEAFDVIADTTAMSEPHEIEYKLTLKLVE